MPSKKPYFPHNIEGVMDTQFSPVDAETVLENAVHAWEIPSSVALLIRTTDKNTGRVQEFTYQSLRHARNRLEKLIHAGHYDILMADNTAVSMITSEAIQMLDNRPEFDDPV